MECAPPPTESAAVIFGDRLDLAVRYADLLASEGVTRGLIGPREVQRLWERHLLNSAAVAELLGNESAADVGSGAGLPGLVLALVRPNLQITLIEPMARRTAFLDECLRRLGLSNVRVFRGRAEERSTVSAIAGFDVVTSRAVASLDRLAAWCLPLLRINGRMLAVKGASAQAEIDRHQGAVRRLGGSEIAVKRCGVGLIDPPTTVVVVRKVRSDQQGGRRV